MKILIACEMSGIVRREFRARGHDAWSCDILPSEDNSPFHLQQDVIPLLSQGWDMMIGFPPCTFLALCQAWRKHPSEAQCEEYGLNPRNETWRPEQTRLAAEFFRVLWNAPIPRIALENPKSRASTLVAAKSQTIHPWQFGHGETKTTWLWLKNLPPLIPTNIVKGREQRIWKMAKSKTRSIERSLTYAGVAKAMADQWSDPKVFVQPDLF